MYLSPREVDLSLVILTEKLVCSSRWDEKPIEYFLIVVWYCGDETFDERTALVRLS